MYEDFFLTYAAGTTNIECVLLTKFCHKPSLCISNNTLVINICLLALIKGKLQFGNELNFMVTTTATLWKLHMVLHFSLVNVKSVKLILHKYNSVEGYILGEQLFFFYHRNVSCD